LEDFLMTNRYWWLGAVCLAALVFGAPGALADYPHPSPPPTQCVGVIGPVVVRGDLLVPTAATCQLAGTEVTGDVTVQTGGTLNASPAKLDDDLFCNGTCHLSTVVVRDDVVVAAGGSFSADTSTVLSGKLTCNNQSCTLTSSTVRGDVTVAATGTFSGNNASLYEELYCAGSCDLTASKAYDEVEIQAGGTFSETGSTLYSSLSCSNQTCTLNGGEIRSTVSVPSGGTLTAVGATLDSSLNCGGAICELDAPTLVKGDVNATYGGYVFSNGASVGHDAECSRCVGLDLFATQVGGNVESYGQTGTGNFCDNTIAGSLSFTSNGPDSGFNTCLGNTIGRDLTVAANHGPLSITGNQVGGNILLFFNRASSIDLVANHAGWVIKCYANSPPPISAGNTARYVDPGCNQPAP
jgi:hypothetical protein